jgi:transcriptional regulator of acetoin/glycerol metabolism
MEPASLCNLLDRFYNKKVDSLSIKSQQNNASKTRRGRRTLESWLRCTNPKIRKHHEEHRTIAQKKPMEDQYARSSQKFNIV